MSRVASKNTTAELRVRSAAHALGLRFRLHRRNLPGTPDLVFPKRRLALFVHGCFWHRHEGCKKATGAKSRVAFWEAKFKRNVERDGENRSELERLGWRVETIWECDTKMPDRLINRLRQIFYDAPF
jgi:DNA mismatch endonuclease (patch repair protein)